MDSFQREVIDRLARIETHLNGLLETQKDHDKRLGSLEALRVQVLSWSTALAAVVSAAATYILPHLFNRGS